MLMVVFEVECEVMGFVGIPREACGASRGGSCKVEGDSDRAVVPLIG